MVVFKKMVGWITATIQQVAKRITGTEIHPVPVILATGNKLVWYFLCCGPIVGVNMKLDPDVTGVKPRRWISISAVLLLMTLIVLAPDDHLRLGLLLLICTPLWLYAFPKIYDPLMENRAYILGVGVAVLGAWAAARSFWFVILLGVLWGAQTFIRARFWNTRYEFWRQAYKDTPTFTRPRINWAVALSKNDEFDESMDLYREFIAAGTTCHDSALAAANLSLLYYYMNGLTNDNVWMRHSAELLTYAVHVWPANPRIRFNRGNMFMGYRRWEEAAEEFSFAIKVFPKYSSAYRQRARCYAMMGDLVRAKEDARIADEGDGRKAVIRLMHREGETDVEYEARLKEAQAEDPLIQPKKV